MRTLVAWPFRPDALRCLSRDIRGNAAIETAFMVPAVMLFTLGIMQTGQAMWLQNALNYAVAEAARCASVSPSTCGTTTQTKSYASTLSGYNFDTSIFTVSTPSCGNQVAAAYPMTLSIYTLSISVTLTAQACYPA